MSDKKLKAGDIPWYSDLVGLPEGWEDNTYYRVLVAADMHFAVTEAIMFSGILGNLKFPTPGAPIWKPFWPAMVRGDFLLVEAIEKLKV